MLRETLFRGLPRSNPRHTGFACSYNITLEQKRSHSSSDTASTQFSAVVLRNLVHGETQFRRQTAFDSPSSIVALFVYGKKAYFSNGTAAKSKFALSDVVLPHTLRHRQSLEDGRFVSTASTSQADFDLAERQVEDKEENEGGKNGEEQRMDSDLADSDLDELDNNSTSDCLEANDDLVIQRLLKANPTCEERVEALKQCNITISTDLVLRVLSRHKNDMNTAMCFFVWASQQPGYSHGTETYNEMLNILGRMKQFKTMWQLVEEMHNGGNGPSLVTDETFSILIRRYAAAHMVERANETFYKREEFGLKLNTPAFQILLGALCRYKHVQEAEALLNLREKEFPPDMKSRNIILSGWCALGNLREAKRFWNELIKKGHKPNLITYGIFINGLTKLGGLHEALNLFEAMWNKGCTPDVLICNNIIDALCSKKSISEALVIFAEMNDHGCLPDVATYNSLIKHLCNNRRIDEAYKLFYEMERKGCAPNSRTYHYFLNGAKEPKEALKVFQRMMKSGCMPTSDTYNLMLKMLIVWNDMDTVFRLWNDMERKGMGPDWRSYTVMIHGLYENGRFDEAYNYYNEMAVKGLLLEPRTKILVKAMEIKAKERERKTGVCDTKKKKKRKLDKSSSRVKTKIA